MSEMAKTARAAMKAKAARMAEGYRGKVDGSSYGPEETLNAETKTGMRPVSRQSFKRGGKVEGDAPAQNAGKSPRKLANAIVNRNDKDANEERAGKKHDGGMASGGNAGDAVPKERMQFGPVTGSRMTQAAGLKKGGRAKRGMGGVLKAAGSAGLGGLAGLALSQMGGKDKDEKKSGGRIARKDGGRASKGKVNVNIVIAGKGDDSGGGMAHPGAPPRGLPVAVPAGPPPGGPPPMGGPPPGMPPMGAGAPPPMMPPLGMQPPMPRKRGGRTFADLKAGAGSGVGRLEKIGLQRDSAR